MLEKAADNRNCQDANTVGVPYSNLIKKKDAKKLAYFSVFSRAKPVF